MSNQLKTLTYMVKMDSGGAKKNAKDFQVTLSAMGESGKDVDRKMNELAETLGAKFGKNIKATVQATKSQVNEFKRTARESTRTEQAIQKLTREFAALSAGTGKGADEQQILNAQLRLGANATQKQKDAVRKLVTEYQQLRNTANKTQGSMRSFRGQMSNVGFQLQDVAVQAQMGTNAFVILGQQGSQLAGAFGPAGALIGAGIAFGAMLGNVLLPNLFKTEESVKSVNDRFRELAKTTGITALKAKVLIDAEKEEIRLKQETIKEEEDKIVAYAKSIRTYDEYTAAIDASNKVQEGHDKQIIKTKMSLEEWTKKQKENASEMAIAQANVEDFNDAIKQSKINIDLYFAALGGEGTDKIEEWKESNAELVASLARTTYELDKSKSELLQLAEIQALNTLYTQNATDEQIAQTIALYGIRIARARANEELEEENRLKKEAAKAFKAEQSEYDKFLKMLAEGEAAKEQRLKANAQLEERLGINKMQRLNDQYKTEWELLEGNTQAQAALYEEYERNKLRIQGSSLEKYMLAIEDSMKNFDDIATATINNFSQSFGNAIAGAVFDSENIGDAMKNVFVGVGKSMVAFFAEWAAQELILWTLKQTLGKTAAAGAGAAMGIEAQATSLQAGLSTYASIAAIPIVGPALAPGAMGATLAVTQPIAAVIGGLGAGFAGAKDRGGNIPQDMVGIVSEYRDELANGVLIRGGQGGTKITGGADTARMQGSGMSSGNTFNVTGTQNASAEQITRAIMRKLKGRGGKDLDTAFYEATERGRRNKGNRYARG